MRRDNGHMATTLSEIITSARSKKISKEPLLAVALFAIFSIFVLLTTHKYLEPDDYSYKAAIAALASGHIRLNATQFSTFVNSLTSSGVLPSSVLHGGPALRGGGGPGGLFSGHSIGGGGSSGMLQWHKMATGYYMTEKNYGYVLLATPFYMIGLLNFAPLFYGGLAAFALYISASRWLGRRGGLYAVALYLFSGLSITFAWRSTMETFTDASLVATGVGLILWVFLAKERRQRVRLAVGGLGFLALSMATFARYTDLVALLVALVVVMVFAKRSQIERSTLVSWYGLVFVAMAGIALFDKWAYGAFTSTGYSSGVITFSLSSIWPNLTSVVPQVIVALPASLLALIAIGYVVSRYLNRRKVSNEELKVTIGRDLAVVMSLSAAWFGFWLVYLAYNWTVNQAGASVHVVRFYVPAISFVALLGAFLLAKAPKVAATLVTVAVMALAFVSFYHLTGGSNHGLGGGVPRGPFAGGAGSRAFAGQGGQLPGGFPPGGGAGGAGGGASGAPGGGGLG